MISYEEIIKWVLLTVMVAGIAKGRHLIKGVRIKKGQAMVSEQGCLRQRALLE